MRRLLLRTAAANAALGILGVLSAQAASISFTDGTFTSNAVLPAATSEVYGVGFATSSSVTTANGVVFGADDQTNVAFNAGSTYNAFLSGGGSSGDTNFDKVLTDGIYGDDGQLTLKNLTVGTTYTVLVLVDDTRNCCDSRTGSVSDGTTSSSTIRFAYNGGTPALGAYYQGTFTADATTQLVAVNNQGGNQVDGLVLSAPEPAALSMLAFAGIGLLARRRPR